MNRPRVSTQDRTVWSAPEGEKYLDALPHWVKKIGKSQLREAAREYHKPIIERLCQEGRLDIRDLPEGRQFLHRLMVNYIRYNLVTPDHPLKHRYQGTMQRAIELAGFIRGYEFFNGAILDDIVMNYSFLKEECDNQRVGNPMMEPEDVFREYERTT